MPINRCVCHDITFREIKEIAERRSLPAIEDLREEKICSTQCKLCDPYIREMLKTGQVSFEPGFVPNSSLKK